MYTAAEQPPSTLTAILMPHMHPWVIHWLKTSQRTVERSSLVFSVHHNLSYVFFCCSDLAVNETTLFRQGLLLMNHGFRTWLAAEDQESSGTPGSPPAFRRPSPFAKPLQQSGSFNNMASYSGPPAKIEVRSLSNLRKSHLRVHSTLPRCSRFRLDSVGTECMRQAYANSRPAMRVKPATICSSRNLGSVRCNSY